MLHGPINSVLCSGIAARHTGSSLYRVIGFTFMLHGPITAFSAMAWLHGTDKEMLLMVQMLV